jgi:three-Cys-motif partner protein
LGEEHDYWQLKRNTQIKHDVLYEYLRRWAYILSGRNPKGRRLSLHYVDGFAGRGRYEKGELGSPLIAMEVGQRLNEDRDGLVFLNCYNVERNAANFESLEREVEVAAPLYPSVGFRNFRGLFEEHADDILQDIRADDHTFVFIDPFGYRGVELTQVVKFLERRRSEVFITFMSNYIGRYMTDANRESAMDAIFGTPKWRELAGLPFSSQQASAVKLYGEQLQDWARGKKKDLYVLPIDVSFEDRAADKYHLIHASQHPKGRQAMEVAVDRAKRLSTQETLFVSPEVQEYAVEALQAAPHGVMTALDLAGKVWLRSWYMTWRGDFKEAIRALEASGGVSVRAHDGRNRRHGIEEQDLVALNDRCR